MNCINSVYTPPEMPSQMPLALKNLFDPVIAFVYLFAVFMLTPEFAAELLSLLIRGVSLGIYAPHFLIGFPLIYICYERIQEHWAEADVLYEPTISEAISTPNRFRV